MQGLGFLIWKLGAMPPARQLAALLKFHRVAWVSIKVADGLQRYNQIGGNDKILRDEYIHALANEGIEVGGWHYVYPVKCGPQGALAAERVEKLGLKHLLVNAEAEWKYPGLRSEVNLYLDSLDVNQKFHVSLCSYRYPAYHAPFPFKHFLMHARMKSVTPQVYYLGARNPIEQLEKSRAQYREISDHPYIPIWPTFRWEDWEPGCDELKEIAAYCQANPVPAWGFYSLDWIVKYRRWEWLRAIGAEAWEPPPEPPPADPAVKPSELEVCNCSFLNFRTEPQVAVGNRIGAVRAGTIVSDTGEKSGRWRRIRLVQEAWMHEYYLREKS